MGQGRTHSILERVQITKADGENYFLLLLTLGDREFGLSGIHGAHPKKSSRLREKFSRDKNRHLEINRLHVAIHLQLKSIDSVAMAQLWKNNCSISSNSVPSINHTFINVTGLSLSDSPTQAFGTTQHVQHVNGRESLSLSAVAVVVVLH